MKFFNRSISTVQEIRIYKIIITFLLLGFVFLSYGFFITCQEKAFSWIFSLTERMSFKKLPYQEEIMKIIRPLRYSGIPALLREEVFLSIDFENAMWTLHNIHRYDAGGNILLDEDRYGLCGELASYAYGKIYPLIKNDYDIAFARVAESGFFLHPESTHIALLIYNMNTSEAYFLDPTFQRYGQMEDFKNYLFFEFSETIEGIPERDPDVSFPVDTGTPVLLHKDFLTVFSVNRVNGQFDQNNFSFELTASRRHQYAGRYIFGIRKRNGVLETFEDPWITKDAIPRKDAEKIKQRLALWFKQLQ